MHLWQHPNGIWYVRHGHRLRHRASTRTRDRKAAEIFLSRFIAAHSIAAPENPTVGFLLQGYETDALARTGEDAIRSPTSLKSCHKALRPYFENLRPEHLTPAVIREFVKLRGRTLNRSGRKISNGTILRDLGYLRSSLDFGVRHKLIPAAPHIPNVVKVPPRRERWLTKDEARRLIAACVEPHVKLFAMIALMTGARTSAVLEAKWSQVNWDRRLIDFGQGHGNKNRAIVPINPDLERALKAAKEMGCSEYIVEYRGRPIKWPKKGFAAACRRAGLEDVTPHIMRHSAATWMVMDGVPLREIARTLGDSEEMIEERYGKHSPDYLRRATNALTLETV